MCAVYHGRGGMVYVSTNGTGNPVLVGKLTRWRLEQPTDRAETTGMGDDNKNYVQGLKDCRGSLSGFWQDSDDTLFQAGDSADGCKMYLYPSKNCPTKYFYGPAWLDMTVEASVNGPVTLEATFAANGNWGRKV